MKIVVGLLLFALVVAGAVWAWVAGVGTGKPPQAEIAPLLKQKNVALAELENNRLAEAIAPLREIAKAAPRDRFAWQNLAVAGLLAAEGIDRRREAEKFADAMAAAGEGVDGLERLIPGRPVTYYLRGVRLRREGKNREAYDLFVQAARVSDDTPEPDAGLGDAGGLSDDAATYWYAAFLALKDSQDETERSLGRSALFAAVGAAPRNLAVYPEAILEAAEHEPDKLPELLKQSKEVVETVRAEVKQRNRIDLVELLEQAEELIASGEEAKVRQAVGRLRGWVNVVRAQPLFASDRRDLDPNLLEFVRLDFGERFYDAYAPAEYAAFGPITFDAEPLDENIAAVAASDTQRDGSAEVVTLRTDVTAFSVEALGSEYAAEGDFAGLLLADLDNDFAENSVVDINSVEGVTECRTTDVDVLLYGQGGLRVLLNKLADGLRSLEPVEDETLASVRGVTVAAIADVDAEGDLDIVADTADGVRLFLNRGDATFEEAPFEIIGGPVFGVRRMIPADLDRDVDVDVLLCVDSKRPVAYLENLRHGRMRLRTLPQGLRPGETATDVALLDADANASWDILLTTDQRGQLLRSFTFGPADWKVVDVSDVDIKGRVAAGDFDNDGLQDVLSAAGLHRGVRGEPFLQPAEPVAGLPADLAGAEVADLDGDGKLDAVTLGEGGAAVRLSNTSAEVGNHAVVTLLAQQQQGGRPTESGRVNAYGVGSTLEVRAGGRFVPAVVGGPGTHVGLGAIEEPDSLRSIWTNGIPQNVLKPGVNVTLCERQKLTGSCPYLYAWDGERFVFVTDCLWNAPIGLQLADGVQAVPRHWEHLLLPGRFVAEKDGRVELRMTEELWEAAYFDKVRLRAVDHPAGTHLHTNEKVGPPELAEERLFAFEDVTPAASVRAVYADGRVRDLTAETRERDGVFARPWRSKVTQGYVEPVGLEIDVPAEAKHLVLTGWLRPTGTSLNVALSNDPRYEGPKPPMLRVRDGSPEAVDPGRRVGRSTDPVVVQVSRPAREAAGRPVPTMADLPLDGWSEGVFVGFPGGKTKSIVVPLPPHSGGGEIRTVRLDTSMEFSWDFVASAGGGDADRTQHECELLSADLRYRGFSRHLPERAGGPEDYDYADVSADAAWPPMRGRFTRFGDVRELLSDADDRLAVIGQGDEIALSFAAPPPPPEGWVRDWVITCVGWDKDADLNTLYGESSEPYPTLDTVEYPDWHAFEGRADAEFQTRRQVP